MRCLLPDSSKPGPTALRHQTRRRLKAAAKAAARLVLHSARPPRAPDDTSWRLGGPVQQTVLQAEPSAVVPPAPQAWRLLAAAVDRSPSSACWSLLACVSGSGCAGSGPALQAGSLTRRSAARSALRPPWQTTRAQPCWLAATSCSSPSWSFPSWRLGLRMHRSRPCPPSRQASPGGYGP